MGLLGKGESFRLFEVDVSTVTDSQRCPLQNLNGTSHSESAARPRRIASRCVPFLIWTPVRGLSNVETGPD
jgi:hypothetical protein